MRIAAWTDSAPRRAFSITSSTLRLDVFAAGLLARAATDGVDAEPASELREPGAERRVVAQLLEVLVRAREHLLEDVVGVRLGQRNACGDRVDVAGIAVDERTPALVVAVTATRDELRVGQLVVHRSIIALPAGIATPAARIDQPLPRNPHALALELLTVAEPHGDAADLSLLVRGHECHRFRRVQRGRCDRHGGCSPCRPRAGRS